MQMPQSIVKLKGVSTQDKEVWLDLTPEYIKQLIDQDLRFIECRRFIGMDWYAFIVNVDCIATIEPYR